MVRLMNALPTDLQDQPLPAVRRAELTTEDAGETREVLKALRAGRRTGTESTRGHWKRPVE